MDSNLFKHVGTNSDKLQMFKQNPLKEKTIKVRGMSCFFRCRPRIFTRGFRQDQKYRPRLREAFNTWQVFKGFPNLLRSVLKKKVDFVLWRGPPPAG